jgi:hypothetical protein
MITSTTTRPPNGCDDHAAGKCHPGHAYKAHEKLLWSCASIDRDEKCENGGQGHGAHERSTATTLPVPRRSSRRMRHPASAESKQCARRRKYQELEDAEPEGLAGQEPNAHESSCGNHAARSNSGSSNHGRMVRSAQGTRSQVPPPSYVRVTPTRPVGGGPLAQCTWHESTFGRFDGSQIDDRGHEHKAQEQRWRDDEAEHRA